MSRRRRQLPDKSLQPKALARNWLLGYLLKTDMQIQGVLVCVCVLCLLQKATLPLVCMHVLGILLQQIKKSQCYFVETAFAGELNNLKQ